VIACPRLCRVVCFVIATCGSGVASAQTTSASAPHEWTLETVLGTALAQHPMVEAAEARVAAARGGRVTAGTFPNPVATLWVENATLPGQTARTGIARETSTYFTVPLEPLFQRGPQMRSADERIKAAEADVIGERREVAAETAHAFYRVAQAQLILDTAEESRAGLESLVTYNRTRVDVGATAELDLLRAQVELDRSTTTVDLARIDLLRSWAALRPYLGAAAPVMPPPAATAAAVPRVRVPEVGTGTLPTSLTDLVAEARTRRPEVRAAQARVAAAASESEYQRTLLFRHLGATVGFKQVNGDSTLLAALSVPVPLFDRNHGEIQRATSAALAAQKELSWSERQVEADVQGAFEASQLLGAQAGARQRTTVDRAAEVHRVTLAAYQEGASSLLQVLDAARTLADARQSFSRAMLMQQESAFDLALAAGLEPLPTISILQSPPALATSEPTARGASR
jgi:cobalt-zinc-cadmium efflux system outer membrane protein